MLQQLSYYVALVVLVIQSMLPLNAAGWAASSLNLPPQQQKSNPKSAPPLVKAPSFIPAKIQPLPSSASPAPSPKAKNVSPTATETPETMVKVKADGTVVLPGSFFGKNCAYDGQSTILCPFSQTKLGEIRLDPKAVVKATSSGKVVRVEFPASILPSKIPRLGLVVKAGGVIYDLQGNQNILQAGESGDSETISDFLNTLPAVPRVMTPQTRGNNGGDVGTVNGGGMTVSGTGGSTSGIPSGTGSGSGSGRPGMVTSNGEVPADQGIPTVDLNAPIPTAECTDTASNLPHGEERQNPNHPLSYPVFQLDTSGALTDATKITQSQVRLIPWVAPTVGRGTDTPPPPPPASTQAASFQCDFENDACEFSGSPSRFYRSTCDATACRANGENAFSDACDGYGCMINGGEWAVPIKGSHSALLSLGEFAREAWMERAVPQGIISISFDHGHTWGMRNCPSGYCSNLYATLQVLLDGQEVANYIPEYQRDTSVDSSSYVMQYVAPWKHESISIDPSRPHNLRFKIAVYDRGNPRDDQALIDNIAFAGNNNSPSPPPPSQNSYSIRLNGLTADNVNMVRVVNPSPTQVVMAPGGGARLVLSLPSAGASFNAESEVQGTKDPLDNWFAISGLPIVRGQRIYTRASHDYLYNGSLNAGDRNFFAVEADLSFDDHGTQKTIKQSVNVAADTAAPTVASGTLTTLGTAILPWLGAFVNFDVADDLGLKKISLPDYGGLYDTYFSPNVYTLGSTTHVTGKIYLPPEKATQLVTQGGGQGQVDLRMIVEDIAGKTTTFQVTGDMNAPNASNVIRCNSNTMTAGSSTTCTLIGAPSGPGIRQKFKVWKNGVSADALITDAGVFTPTAIGNYEVEAVLLTTDGKYLGKRTNNIVYIVVNDEDPNLIVMPMGLGNHTTMVCRERRDCLDNTIVSYDVFRDDVKITSAPISKAIFERDCFIDGNVPMGDARYSPTNQHQYYIQANLQESGTGQSSGVRRSGQKPAHVILPVTEFKFDHVPLPEQPMHFAVRTGHNQNDLGSLLEVRVFPLVLPGRQVSNNADYCFMQQGGDGSMLPNCQDTRNGVLTSHGEAYFRWTDVAYDHPSAQQMEVMVGDLASWWDKLTVNQQNIALDNMEADYSMIPIDQLKFYGNALSFGNATPAIVSDVQIPVNDFDGFQKLALSIDPTTHDYRGLLTLPEYREWFAHISMFRDQPMIPGFVNFNVEDPNQADHYVPSYVSLLIYDSFLAEGRMDNYVLKFNLYHSASSLIQDWLPFLDILKNRFFKDFVSVIQNDESKMATVAEAYLALLNDAYSYKTSDSGFNNFGDAVSYLRNIATIYHPISIHDPAETDDTEPWPSEFADIGTCNENAEDLGMRRKIRKYLDDLQDAIQAGEYVHAWPAEELGTFRQIYSILNDIYEAHQFSFSRDPSPGTVDAIVYAVYKSNTVKLNMAYCNSYSPDHLMHNLIHEGVHALHDRQFIQTLSNDTLLGQLSDLAGDGAHDLYLLLAYHEGRMNLFTESKAYEYAESFNGRGAYDSARERTRLYESLKCWNRFGAKWFDLGILNNVSRENCAVGNFGYTRQGHFIPWDPIGKSSPWE